MTHNGWVGLGVWRVQDLGKPIDVPAAFVSANPNTTTNIIMKIANHRAFYLVDVKGTFYNRKKLESMITFRTDFVRSWCCSVLSSRLS